MNDERKVGEGGSATFVSGLAAPETPRLMADGSWLIVEMAPPRGGVTHISQDGATVRPIAATGTPNGLVVNSQDRILVAETHPHPGLYEVTMDGTVTLLADSCGLDPFLLPNDVCFGPDGALYMTDSGMLMSDWAPEGALREDWATADFDGKVYRIEPDAASITIVDRGLRFTNGIAFGPDGLLYANEMITGDVFRYDIASGTPSREYFGNVMAAEWPGGFRGPDGMAFGANGLLYCAVYGQGDITVLNGQGTVVDRIPTAGSNPTNVGFGPNGETKMYITEHELGQIEVIDAPTQGAPLHDGWVRG